MTRQDLIHKWAVYALALLPVWLLDSCILPRFPLFGVTPMLLPLALTAVAVLEVSGAGGGFGLAVGLVWTLSYPLGWGGTVLGMTLAGAAIGAGAGAGASYLVAKYNNERDDRVRLASYARDLNADVNSLNRVTAAGQVAYNCYSAKFRAALEDYKAKRITRAELDQRYAEIKSGLAEASAILGSTLSEADKREAEYRQVLTIEAKKASRPIPPVQTVATTSKKTSKATKTVTRKQTGDQLQNLSNGVGSYKESTAQLTAVKSDLDEIQLQMDKVMLAQG